MLIRFLPDGSHIVFVLIHLTLKFVTGIQIKQSIQLRLKKLQRELHSLCQRFLKKLLKLQMK